MRQEEALLFLLRVFLFPSPTVTPSIKGPVAEGSRLLLICSLTHPRGHEHFQWRQLSSGLSNGSSFEATPRSPGVQRYYLGSTLELTHVCQEDIGTWECSVHGSEGRLGAVEYELYITGTVSPVPHFLHPTPLPSPCAPRLLLHLTHLTSQHFPNLIHTPN